MKFNEYRPSIYSAQKRKRDFSPFFYFSLILFSFSTVLERFLCEAEKRKTRSWTTNKLISHVYKARSLTCGVLFTHTMRNIATKERKKERVCELGQKGLQRGAR
jgi:hypothetical protein